MLACFKNFTNVFLNEFVINFALNKAENISQIPCAILASLTLVQELLYAH